MPVPGLTPELPLRAKVRIGEKVSGVRQDGTRYERAAATDHFLCPEPDFERIAGPRPKTLRIHFPYQGVAQCFPSGLEKWARSKTGRPLLLCYTKGDDVAHGLGGHLDSKGLTQLDPKKDRQDFPCLAGRCRYYGKKPSEGCRPQARLNFQLVGGARDSVYRFETKSINTIESIEAVLAQYGDLRGIDFDLTVQIVKRGAKEFPIVTLAEVASPSGASPQVVADVPADPGADGEAAASYGGAEFYETRLRALGQWPPSPALVAWIDARPGHEVDAALKARETAA